MRCSLRSVFPFALLTGILMAPLPAAQAGVNVYVTDSGNTTADAAVVSLLASFGHTVTLGVPFTAFDGTQSLAGINAVYLQVNYNWNTGDMPTAGQTALVNFINGGGGLVTTEWALWNAATANQFATLAPLFPVVPTTLFDFAVTGTFNQATANTTLNNGLPGSFTTDLGSIGGTESHFTTLRPGATSYYTNNEFIGVAGINAGSGRVLSFNTVNADVQIADPNFGRLLSNSMYWSAGVAISATAPEPGTFALWIVAGLPLVIRATQARKRHSAT